MPRPKRPEPLQPGDEQIAREEVEAYYTRPVEVVRAELAKEQARFDRVQARTDAAIAAFRAGDRLPEIDAWEIEARAGNVGQIARDLLSGRSVDEAAYDRAKARQGATARWLKHQGYEPIEERHP